MDLGATEPMVELGQVGDDGARGPGELGKAELKLMVVLEATKMVVELGAAELMVLGRRSSGARSGGGHGGSRGDGVHGGAWGCGAR